MNMLHMTPTRLIEVRDFFQAHWQVYSGSSILSEALLRMEVYEVTPHIIGFGRSKKKNHTSLLLSIFSPSSIYMID